ncbi:N-acetylneuraminate synthase [Lacrimispora saccharolytica]|uniref:N-acetylneuraminate synthase n=1 Tax=Lacrimispora saccharolytica (strain ATCC 35040 / DSM 2544 / NRCC 2533 / WM1) TaxID=610130 RepID=D9R721_LACSW|nr:N-acetylneuraminate synthase [Lacrimispora saccharolytica]ADL05453.1 N-acetylneuraminate synthase [[Clostridium] saccharolyticum WM1]QRV20384.1 N-acetylneuraminate synthase [Lacrimispora saccharolytica]
MSKIMIIAEAGVNHNGDITIAKQLIDAASVTGADAIKFQTFKTDLLVVPASGKAEYQIKNTGGAMSQYEMLKNLELSWQAFEELYHYCALRHIKFLSSPFDEESILFLDRLGVDPIKIPSGEITNYGYLKKTASLKKQVLLSTGMSTEAEIGEALEILEESGKEIILLHCSSAYPTMMEDVNLNAMATLKDRFHKQVGYSDHTPGIEVPIAAAALGACVIEKHMTLDKTMPGPDHKASLEPDEFKHMADSIRNIEQALGDGVKRPTLAELKNRDYVRKYLVAAREIRKGEAFTLHNLCAKRCGYGISPMELHSLLGKTADRNYQKDERIVL